jgi:hypothetical protein
MLVRRHQDAIAAAMESDPNSLAVLEGLMVDTNSMLDHLLKERAKVIESSRA